MLRSARPDVPGRVLTTHVGSLPRPPAVVDMLLAEDRGTLTDRAAFDAVMHTAVHDVVARQVEAGIDVVSDGEMSKISYATYIRHRLTGFVEAELPRASPRDLDEFPSLKERIARTGGTPEYLRPVCRGPIEVKDLAPLQRDLEFLRSACSDAGATRAFMNAPAPGTIAIFQPNEYYATEDDYLQALGEGMRAEYEAIVDSGVTLQVDCPDLALGRHTRYRDLSDEEFLERARRQVEVLNHALRNVPADAVRVHLCWGNYEGPHIHDIPLGEIIDVVLAIDADAFLFEAANPRHAHEWAAWRDVDLRPEHVLVPGCVDTSTNYVEHPQLIAERLEHYISIAGVERVMAGTDCGFGTFAGFGAVDPSVCYRKLGSLVEGAALASRHARA